MELNCADYIQQRAIAKLSDMGVQHSNTKMSYEQGSRKTKLYRLNMGRNQFEEIKILNLIESRSMSGKLKG